MYCIETWLDSELSNSEVNISGYGVLVYAKTQLGHDASIVPLPLAIDNLEFLPMSFTFCNHKFCIATFYCPPSSTALYFDRLYFVLQQLNIVSFLVLYFVPLT